MILLGESSRFKNYLKYQNKVHNLFVFLVFYIFIFNLLNVKLSQLKVLLIEIASFNTYIQVILKVVQIF